MECVPCSPERFRDDKKHVSSLHVRVHQSPKDVLSTVPLGNLFDKFHHSVVHSPIIWNTKLTKAKKEKTTSAGCSIVSTLTSVGGNCFENLSFLKSTLKYLKSLIDWLKNLQYLQLEFQRHVTILCVPFIGSTL